MRILKDVAESIVFICKSSKINEDISGTPVATGFFVSIESSRVPSSRHVYLVTAKHVSAKVGTDFTIRINRTGKASYIQIKNIQWFAHPNQDENPADVEVCAFPFLDDFDSKHLPTEMFLRDENFEIGDVGLGDEVFLTGLFSDFIGTKKNIPIFRVGNLVMIPDEKVPTREFGNIDAYLIEARSLGGISGSPVFVRKPGALLLAGLIHGHWDIPIAIENKLPPSDSMDNEGRGRDSINMGIAIVTPAKKILEILEREDLKKLRQEVEDKWLEKIKSSQSSS